MIIVNVVFVISRRLISHINVTKSNDVSAMYARGKQHKKNVARSLPHSLVRISHHIRLFEIPGTTRTGPIIRK